MASKHIDFPNLGTWAKNSEPDPKYNCIAFAAGRTDVYWWPDDYPDPDSDYWPAGITREETVAAVVELFQSLGYEVCSDGMLETGFERIAIYAVGQTPTHAARQTSTGAWTSKLGVEEDITHTTPESLVGPCYGQIACFMQRRR